MGNRPAIRGKSGSAMASASGCPARADASSMAAWPAPAKAADAAANAEQSKHDAPKYDAGCSSGAAGYPSDAAGNVPKPNDAAYDPGNAADIRPNAPANESSSARQYAPAIPTGADAAKAAYATDVTDAADAAAAGSSFGTPAIDAGR